MLGHSRIGGDLLNKFNHQLRERILRANASNNMPLLNHQSGSPGAAFNELLAAEQKSRSRVKEAKSSMKLDTNQGGFKDRSRSIDIM